jgi:hypothetical protein
MSELNWKIFELKFENYETTAFEHLAYDYFCYKFDIKEGLTRYANHPKIETEPYPLLNTDKNTYTFSHCQNIKIIGEVGFQAKYFKNEKIDVSQIKKSFQDILNVYPNLEFIILFSNVEHSNSKKSAYSKFKNDFENKNNIKIIEIFKSNFEQILNINNKELRYLREAYFENKNDIILFESNLKQSCKISADTFSFTFDDKRELKNKITLSSSDILFIYGEKSTGKTEFIYNFYNERQNEVLFTNYNFFLDNIISFTDFYFLDKIKIEGIKYLIIDEYLDINQPIFSKAINKILKFDIKIILFSRQPESFFLSDFNLEVLKIELLSNFIVDKVLRNFGKNESNIYRKEDLRTPKTLNDFIENRINKNYIPVDFENKEVVTQNAISFLKNQILNKTLNYDNNLQILVDNEIIKKIGVDYDFVNSYIKDYYSRKLLLNEQKNNKLFDFLNYNFSKSRFLEPAFLNLIKDELINSSTYFDILESDNNYLKEIIISNTTKSNIIDIIEEYPNIIYENYFNIAIIRNEFIDKYIANMLFLKIKKHEKCENLLVFLYPFLEDSSKISIEEYFFFKYGFSEQNLFINYNSEIVFVSNELNQGVYNSVVEKDAKSHKLIFNQTNADIFFQYLTLWIPELFNATYNHNVYEEKKFIYQNILKVIKVLLKHDFDKTINFIKKISNNSLIKKDGFLLFIKPLKDHESRFPTIEIINEINLIYGKYVFSIYHLHNDLLEEIKVNFPCKIDFFQKNNLAISFIDSAQNIKIKIKDDCDDKINYESIKNLNFRFLIFKDYDNVSEIISFIESLRTEFEKIDALKEEDVWKNIFIPLMNAFLKKINRVKFHKDYIIFEKFMKKCYEDAFFKNGFDFFIVNIIKLLKSGEVKDLFINELFNMKLNDSVVKFDNVEHFLKLRKEFDETIIFCCNNYSDYKKFFSFIKNQTSEFNEKHFLLISNIFRLTKQNKVVLDKNYFEEDIVNLLNKNAIKNKHQVLTLVYFIWLFDLKETVFSQWISSSFYEKDNLFLLIKYSYIYLNYDSSKQNQQLNLYLRHCYNNFKDFNQNEFFLLKRINDDQSGRETNISFEKQKNIIKEKEYDYFKYTLFLLKSIFKEEKNGANIPISFDFLKLISKNCDLFDFTNDSEEYKIIKSIAISEEMLAHFFKNEDLFEIKSLYLYINKMEYGKFDSFISKYFL